MTIFRRVFEAFACSILLISCSSGSSSGPPTSPPPPSPPPAPPPPAVADYTAIQLDPLPGDEEASAHDVNNMGQIVGWSLGSSKGQTATIWTVDATGAVTAEDLGTLPGGTFSFANGINDVGQVVGFADGATGTRRPFIWTVSNGMQDLGAPVAMIGGMALRINDSGQIVGAVFETEFSSLPDQGRLALWEVEQTGAVLSEQDLGTLGGRAAAGFDINNSGHVVGDIWQGFQSQVGFFWSPQDGVVEINVEEALGINDNDEVVGIRLSTGNNGYVWTHTGGVVEINGGRATAINNSGQVTGLPNSDGPVFIWENGEYRNLPMPDNFDSGIGWSINGAGWIAGSAMANNGLSTAVVWVPN